MLTVPRVSAAPVTPPALPSRVKPSPLVASPDQIARQAWWSAVKAPSLTDGQRFALARLWTLSSNMAHRPQLRSPNAEIRIQGSGGSYYLCSPQACNCPGAPKATLGWCKHRIYAWRLAHHGGPLEPECPQPDDLAMAAADAADGGAAWRRHWSQAAHRPLPGILPCPPDCHRC